MSKPSTLVSRAEFARMCGVTSAAITKACRTALSGAKVRDRINTEHAAAKKYLARRKPRAARSARGKTTPAKPPAPADDAKPKRKRAATTDEPAPTAVGGDVVTIEDYLDLTLRELVDRFGTERAFKDWLEAAKKIEDIRGTRLETDKLQGSLISRELVKTHVFGWLDAGLRRLVTDSPRTISRRVYAAARAKEPLEKAESIVREIIESQLRPMKANAARILRKGE